MRADVREETLITAEKRKERRLSLRKVNRVEVVIIHVVAVENVILFQNAVRQTVRHGRTPNEFLQVRSIQSDDVIEIIYKSKIRKVELRMASVIS